MTVLELLDESELATAQKKIIKEYITNTNEALIKLVRLSGERYKEDMGIVLESLITLCANAFFVVMSSKLSKNLSIEDEKIFIKEITELLSRTIITISEIGNN